MFHHAFSNMVTVQFAITTATLSVVVFIRIGLGFSDFDMSSVA